MPSSHILIVEDSKTQKLLLQTTLEKAGHSVAVSQDGFEALEYLNNDDFPLPDLIISDILMPKMNGLMLCSKIRESFSEVFTILLTASVKEDALKKSFESGAVDFLEKPFNKTELLLRVNNVLRIKKAEDSLKQAMNQLAENNKILKKLSITDELTRLSNRRKLIAQLKEKIYDASRYSTPLSLILFDIDHFKKINDTYGHLSGDEVLKNIAEVFLNSLRSTDIAGRYGGEEFLLILPNTALEKGITVAKTLNEKIKKLTFEFAPDAKVTISGGICEYSNEIKYEHLLAKVDDLLYVAKDKGRDRIEY
jgi:two-component system, cell cycle response regulator